MVAQSNLRTLKSRNQREGKYAGKKLHFYHFFDQECKRHRRSNGYIGLSALKKDRS